MLTVLFVPTHYLRVVHRRCPMQQLEHLAAMPRLVFNPLLAPLVFIVTANAHDSSLRGANPQSMEV